MSLTSSMWTSVSGLLVHGEKMGVVGNNISNINTVGFKASRMDFEDFMSQHIGTAAGMGQVGRGTSIGIVMNDFSQGSYEQTTNATDIAISGNGFFCVKPKNDNTNFYTRAGNFRFDKDGFLTDPHGYVLQGWRIDNSARSLAANTGASSSNTSAIIGTGSPVDIRLDTFNCPPRHTSNVTMAINLDSVPDGNDKTTDPDDPFFALLKNWNATPNSQGKILPLGSQSYAFSNTIEVFDEGGQSHTLTVYFDRVLQNSSTNINGLANNEIVFEYIVTMDPSSDRRNFSDDPNNPIDPKYKGLLMSGTMTFNSSGQFVDQAAYVPTDNNMGDLSTWVQSPISGNGFPVLAPNFSGQEGASSAWDRSVNPPVINSKADGRMIEMNFGLRSTTSTWDPSMPATAADWTSKVTSTDPATFYRVQKDSKGNRLYYQKSTSATPPSGWPTGGVAGGPTITWQAYTPQIPGEVTDTNGLIFAQRTATQGARSNEALGLESLITGSSGYIYTQLGEQTYGGITGTVFHNPADGKLYLRDKANPNNYYEVDPNAGGDKADPSTWGISSTAVNLPPAQVENLTVAPNPAAPVTTTTPVDSSNPKFIVDSNGNAIQATVTSPNPGMGTNAERLNTTSTAFTNNTGNNFYERFAAQDGYTYGELRYVTVSREGVLSGAYSNGVTLELFQLTLSDFPSKQHLRREGGNLFTETRESGLAISGAAGTGSFGVTEANQLEQSNVDLSREFVYMITTQKGFQANSKTITTVDTMLDTVINMKR